jgi:hypothetical protein
LCCIDRNKPAYIPEAEVPDLYRKVGFKWLASINEDRSDEGIEPVTIRCGQVFEGTWRHMINLRPNRTLKLKHVKALLDQYYESSSSDEDETKE